MKPDTTLGYVAIGSRENAQLTEKTDREGFIDTPAYRNFSALMTEFLRFTGEVQGLLRREYLEFAKSRAADDAGVDDSSPESVSDAIEATLKDGEALQTAVAATKSRLSDALDAADEATKTPPHASTDEVVARSRQATEVLRSAMLSADATLQQLTDFLSRVEIAQKRNLLLQQEVALMRAQLDDGIEAMGLGLTAEALSHEMFTIADGLASRTRDVAQRVGDSTIGEPDVQRYVEYVRGSVGALRKELAHFSPSLRYVRERREVIDIRSFAAEIVDYYSSRWSDRGIRVSLEGESSGPFEVRGSRGKLTQVFDNLILNSGYWVGVAKDQGLKDAATITVRLHRPFITMTDNGPGVEPSVESSLFEAFVTRKPRGTGRGLGLFIVRQLLEGDDCTVALGPKRGEDGRRREFVVNLGGILDEP